MIEGSEGLVMKVKVGVSEPETQEVENSDFIPHQVGLPRADNIALFRVKQELFKSNIKRRLKYKGEIISSLFFFTMISMRQGDYNADV